MEFHLFRSLFFGIALALVSLFSPQYSLAAPLCEGIFTKSTKSLEAPKGIYNKIHSHAEFKTLEPQIRKMINFLLVANKNIPAIENILSEISPSQPYYLEVMDRMDKTNFMLIRLETHTGNILDLRTNGSFVFLSSSYKYRQYFKTHNYYAVGMNGQAISTFKQTDLILATLPDKVVLSRNLKEEERTMWLKGGRFVGNFGPKVHFAPNHFTYMKTEPYRIEMTKEQLLEFHARNELEINIYDPVNSASKRMQTTEVGIEFEYVFVGENAIENLRPLMKEQLKQGVLIYEKF